MYNAVKLYPAGGGILVPVIKSQNTHQGLYYKVHEIARVTSDPGRLDSLG